MRTKKNGQNLIEVVLIIPLLIVLLFGLLEYALFQRNVNVVQDIALEAAVVASKKYVAEDADPNPAAVDALAVVQKRLGALGITGLTFVDNDLGPVFGTRPYALYEYKSSQTVVVDGKAEPLVTFTVDYRDPFQDGVSTQLIFYHNMVLFGTEFPLPNGTTITIIPKNVMISSTQTQQYVHY